METDNLDMFLHLISEKRNDQVSKILYDILGRNAFINYPQYYIGKDLEKYTKTNYTIKSIAYLARLDSPDIFNEWLFTGRIFLSKSTILTMFSIDTFYINGQLYFFEDNILKPIQESKLDMKIYNTTLKFLKNIPTNIRQFIVNIRNTLKAMVLLNNVKFNSNSNILVWNDVTTIYDGNEFVVIDNIPENFCTMKMGVSFNGNKNLELKNELLNILNEIFPNCLEYVLKSISSLLITPDSKNVKLLIGESNSGKSTIIKIIEILFGTYISHNLENNSRIYILTTEREVLIDSNKHYLLIDDFKLLKYNETVNGINIENLSFIPFETKLKNTTTTKRLEILVRKGVLTDILIQYCLEYKLEESNHTGEINSKIESFLESLETLI